MAAPIRVAVAGAAGRMGATVCDAVADAVAQGGVAGVCRRRHGGEAVGIVGEGCQVGPDQAGKFSSHRGHRSHA